MTILLGCGIGFVVWFLVTYLLAGLYTVDQNERAVKTVFGRAERIPGKTTLNDPIAESLTAEERERYSYPQVRVIPPGGPYFKWPWEKVYKVSVATQTLNMAYDPEQPDANSSGTMLDAVTKDQLNTGLTGQIRYRVSERNLYAYLFGVKQPDRACDGLLHLGAARAHRQFRGARGQAKPGPATAPMTSAR